MSIWLAMTMENGVTVSRQGQVEVPNMSCYNDYDDIEPMIGIVGVHVNSRFFTPTSCQEKRKRLGELRFSTKNWVPSDDQNHGWLGYIGHCTTQLYRHYNTYKPI